jgi:hypothetical protein
MGTSTTVAFVAVAVAAVASVVLAFARQRREREPRRRPIVAPRHHLDDELLDDADRAAMDEALTAVAAELSISAQTLLLTRVARLTSRAVPLRVLQPAGEPHEVRACFADGTVLRVRSADKILWGPVAIALTRGSVCLASFTVAGGDIVVVFEGGHGFRREAVAVGLDQPT